jgi:hypothetical protein
VGQKFSHAGNVRRHAGELLAAGLDQNVGQTVPVAIAPDPACQCKNIGMPIMAQHLVLCLRAFPFDAMAEPERLRHVLQIRKLPGASSHVNEPP